MKADTVAVVGIVLSAASVVAGIAAALIAWLAYRSTKRVEKLGTERSVVEWEVRKLSDGTFEVGNIGQDPAHEVTVEMWTPDEIARQTADVVPPVPAEGSALRLVLPQRETNGPDEPEGMPKPFPRPPGFPVPDDTLEMFARLRNDAIGWQVEVRVAWRSARHRWSTWEDQTG